MSRNNSRAEARCRYHIRQEATNRGWNTRHINRGGNVLEEQETVATFPDIGLGKDKPDFVFCLAGNPVMTVEAKNEPGKLDEAISEAIDYANQINNSGKYQILIAVGAAGEEDSGFTVTSRFLVNGEWKPLISNGFELTGFPSKKEIELACEANDGSTQVTIPTSAEFIDSAIQISRVLRLAKIEAPLRPKVIGALVLALYQGTIEENSEQVLESVNSLVKAAIDNSVDLSEINKTRLYDALHLSHADFNRLSPFVGRVCNLLRRLNIRSVIHTDADFLGMFYEAFLRYGYDNNALGIVFTPRHITRFCVQLTGIQINDKVIDIACGTGGFLVSAMDAMFRLAQSSEEKNLIKESIAGIDTNPQVWALSLLNMFFRGDGKSNIHNASCFDDDLFNTFRRKFTRAYLNPPFSQDGEPEHTFIDRAMETLEPGGLLASIVKAGIFADDHHKEWRKQFLRKHSLLAVISLPEDLFYPTSAPTSIIVVKAHNPQNSREDVFMSRVWNDGYEKLKGKRIDCPGSQLPEVLAEYQHFLSTEAVTSPLVITIKGESILNGEEWSPQEWLPQPPISPESQEELEKSVLKNIFQAVNAFPDLLNSSLPEFPNQWNALPELPYGTENQVDYYFQVKNGKSVGEKNFPEGDTPYISSGDQNNSIIRLVSPDPEDMYSLGGISLTAFGLACLQPWQFIARGNGGSAVRVLVPKFKMTLNELFWFAAQINAQRWRFNYSRMAIKGRITRLKIKSPDSRIPDSATSIYERLQLLRRRIDELINIK